jgi:hypothetical protein
MKPKNKIDMSRIQSYSLFRIIFNECYKENFTTRVVMKIAVLLGIRLVLPLCKKRTTGNCTKKTFPRRKMANQREWVPFIPSSSLASDGDELFELCSYK